MIKESKSKSVTDKVVNLDKFRNDKEALIQKERKQEIINSFIKHVETLEW